MIDLEPLIEIACTEYSDIVVSTAIINHKLRITLIDGSYIDFRWSINLPGRFSHHWERRDISGEIYRHDNSPHSKWKKIKTFPQHFHFGSDSKVVDSKLSTTPDFAVREFLAFARQQLSES
ncbi:MAG: DUF6516 family protein [bacterium]